MKWLVLMLTAWVAVCFLIYPIATIFNPSLKGVDIWYTESYEDITEILSLPVDTVKAVTSLFSLDNVIEDVTNPLAWVESFLKSMSPFATVAEFFKNIFGG